MTKGLFVVGTDTGVGKTVVTAGLVGVLRTKGYNAVPFKPVQSGAVQGPRGLIPLDVEFYQKVCSLPKDKYITYVFEPPLAPGPAAEISGVRVEAARILQDYAVLAEKYELIVVEGAGGLCVPLIGNTFLLTDLIKTIDLPVIVVARPGLGTINHTVLTVKYAQQLGLRIKGIIYNGYDEKNATLAEKTNPNIIEQITGVPTLGIIPRGRNIDVERGQVGNCLEIIQDNIDFSLLLK